MSKLKPLYPISEKCKKCAMRPQCKGRVLVDDWCLGYKPIKISS